VRGWVCLWVRMFAANSSQQLQRVAVRVSLTVAPLDPLVCPSESYSCKGWLPPPWAKDDGWSQCTRPQSTRQPRPLSRTSSPTPTSRPIQRQIARRRPDTAFCAERSINRSLGRGDPCQQYYSQAVMEGRGCGGGLIFVIFPSIRHVPQHDATTPVPRAGAHADKRDPSARVENRLSASGHAHRRAA